MGTGIGQYLGNSITGQYSGNVLADYLMDRAGQAFTPAPERALNNLVTDGTISPAQAAIIRATPERFDQFASELNTGEGLTFPAGPQEKIVGTPLFAASGFEVPATSVQQAQNDLIDYRNILATVAATFRGNASESLLTQTLEDAYTGNTESPLLKAARLDPFTVQNLASTLTPAELNEVFAARIYDTTLNLDSVAQDSFKLANGDIPLTTLDPRFTLARLLLQGQVGDLDDVARSTFKGTAFSMVPLAGNFVAAGQAVSIEQEKSLLIGLRDIGFLSPTALAQRQTAAVLDQQLAAGGILLGGAFAGITKIPKVGGALEKLGDAITTGVTSLFQAGVGGLKSIGRTATESVAGFLARGANNLDAVAAGSVRNVNPTGNMLNCTNCVFVVDNQLATGARASALPMTKPLPFDQLEAAYGTKLSGWTTRSNIESTLLESGNGTRAVVYGMDEAGASAHVWNAAVQRGKINYIDGQIGTSGARNFEYFPYLQFGIIK